MFKGRYHLSENSSWKMLAHFFVSLCQTENFLRWTKAGAKIDENKLLQHDPTTAEIFSQPLLISYKRNKSISNFLVNSTLESSHHSGTLKCARVRCRTCPFISNANKISGPKRAVTITDYFTCVSASLTYRITSALCKTIYIGETGRRLGDRFPV